MLNKPHLTTDFYKVSHGLNVSDTGLPSLYPNGIERIYETLTPRENSFFPHSDKMTVFGYEYFVKKLVDNWNKNFFEKTFEEIIGDFDVFKEMSDIKVYNSMVNKFKALHKLGYLPITVMALPEGKTVPMRVPVLSITNTHEDFYWLPGYLETTLLANTFVTSTVASTAREFRKVATKYGKLSADNLDYIDFQFHDFSQRGQHGDDAAVLSGIAHLAVFKGTDVIPAVDEIKNVWNTKEFIGGSVVATEHSIMESLAGKYGTDFNGQKNAWKYLINNNKSGILSVVADTYDYWQVVDSVLPALKDDIMSRDGKLVVRPDSISESREGLNGIDTTKIISNEQQLVVTLQSLWNTFGGIVNDKGYKVLDPHIGLLQGEGVSLDNVESYLKSITDAGFSAENIVLGVGAYVYSVLVSRDSFGQALKASACIINGEEKQIFKFPKSEKEAFKRSPKGAVSIRLINGEYEMIEGLLIEEAEEDELNQMKIILEEGELSKMTPISVIRDRISESVESQQDVISDEDFISILEDNYSDVLPFVPRNPNHKITKEEFLKYIDIEEGYLPDINPYIVISDTIYIGFGNDEIEEFFNTFFKLELIDERYINRKFYPYLIACMFSDELVEYLRNEEVEFYINDMYITSCTKTIDDILNNPDDSHKMMTQDY